MKLAARYCIVGMCLFFSGCDNNNVFEGKKDFESRYWVFNDPAVFEFEIKNLQMAQGNNATEYPI